MSGGAITSMAGTDRFEIVLAGAVEAAQARSLVEAAAAAAVSGLPVYLDWEAAQKLDTSALQVILALRRKVGATRFLASSPSAALQKWIETAGLAAEFPPAPAGETE